MYIVRYILDMYIYRELSFRDILFRNVCDISMDNKILFSVKENAEKDKKYNTKRVIWKMN